MRPFDFVAPTTLQEALDVLAHSNGDVRPLVGGTDLIDQLKSGRRRTSLVMDIKKIPEMNRLEYYPREGLHIGAAVSGTTVIEYPVAREKYPAVVEGCSLIGSIQIHNRAGIGGNICNAAPSADTVPPVLCYDAKAVVVGPRGRRELALENFFKGPGQTDLAPDEILLEVVLPPPPDNSYSSYLRFIPREEMDIAVVGVGSLLALRPGSTRCRRARITLAAVAPTPVRAREAEEFLQGKAVDEAVIREAGELATRAAKPISDVRGSKEYRLELVRVLTRRTLSRCLEALQR